MMNQTDVMPAPEFHPVVALDSKWSCEHEAFLRSLPSLLATHRGTFVAIHEGQVAGSGDDQAAVALAAYAKYGYVPIYVGLVSDAPQPTARIVSPRLHRPDSA